MGILLIIRTSGTDNKNMDNNEMLQLKEFRGAATEHETDTDTS